MIRIRNSRAFRRLVHRVRFDDSGFSIIEVFVAMLVFMIIAVGVLQAMVVANRSSQDQQHRTVALNLTSAQLDYVRTLGPLAIDSQANAATATVDGITYTTSRTVSPVDQDGADQSCGDVTGKFQLFRVHVETSWGGALASTPKASADALISPDNTIKDPGSGSIFISVRKSDNTAYGSLAVSVKTTGGVAVTAPNTNSDGCSYVSGVQPGSYIVTLNTTGNIDSTQAQPSVSQELQVTPGSAVSVSFNYDVDTSVSMTYGQSSGVFNASDLVTSYFNSNSSSPYYTVSGTPASVNLYPDSAGYNVIAGTVLPINGSASTCLSPDPQNWSAGPGIGGTAMLAGVRQDAVVAKPNTSPSYTMNMGQAQVTLPGTGTYYVVAKTAPAANGDPGCAAGQTYTFQVSGTKTPKLELPYGTWSFNYKTSLLGSLVAISSVQGLTNLISGAPASTVTLDPRAKQ